MFSFARRWLGFTGVMFVGLLGCSTSDAAPSATPGGGTAPTDQAGQSNNGGSSASGQPATAASAGSSGSAPVSGVGGGGGDATTDHSGAGGAGMGGAAGAGAAAGGSSAGASAQYQPVPSGTFDEVKLFEGNPPNYKQDATPETVGVGGRIYDVSIPTIRRYPMDATKSTGIGFVVFPGGGYAELDIERHATALATRMGPLGVAVFGLKYRVGKGTDDARRDALLDANRAIRLVREHADAWGVRADRLGVVSYSAGSNLAMNLAGHFDLGQPGDADPVEAQSSRPSFFASMCTWDSGSATSKFTFLASTPPVYLCHAVDDTTAPIALAYAIEKQLQALGVLEHLEVYASGGHDSFNVGETAAGHAWPDKFMSWLQANSLVP